MKDTAAPVAVFDSGVGGIGVVQEIQKQLPYEDLIYFGDAANAPYGERTTAEIRALVVRHAARLLTTAKALVLACNTATAAAVQTLRKAYPNVPIIGMEPAIKPALAVAAHPRVLILATAATLREEKLMALLACHAGEADFIKVAAPGLVRLVEAGLADAPETDAYLAALLAPFKGSERPDAVVLGCTHFPFARRALLRCFSPPLPLFDGAVGTAQELARRLGEAGLLHSQTTKGKVALTTSDPAVLPLYQKLLQQKRPP